MTAALPPIAGVPWPSWHSAWCIVNEHRDDWQSVLDEGYDSPPPPCRHDIAGGYLPAVYRCDGLPATRVKQPVWAIELEMHSKVDERGSDYVDDSVVVLNVAHEPVLHLLPGEARAIAAALIRAADVEQFSGAVQS